MLSYLILLPGKNYGLIVKTMCYNIVGSSLTAKEFVNAIKKHIPGAEIGVKLSPEVLKIMGKGMPKVEDSMASRRMGVAY